MLSEFCFANNTTAFEQWWNTVLGYKKWSKFVTNMNLKSSDVNCIKVLCFIFDKNAFGSIYNTKCQFLYCFMRKCETSWKYSFRLQKVVKMHKLRVEMTWDTFPIIFLEHDIKKYEHFLKLIFHDSAAHLKEYVSARFFFQIFPFLMFIR